MRKEQLAEYPTALFEQTFSRELSKALSWSSPMEKPTAILLAGQPGAGKTQLSAYFFRQSRNTSILINGDDYRRYHPKYHAIFEQYPEELVPLTSQFASAFTEKMIEALSEAKRNLIIEGTGRTAEVPIHTAKLLMNKGYQMRMAVIAVRPELSLLSTLHRFCSMSEMGTVPRPTAVFAHDTVVQNLPHNLDVLYQSNLFAEMQIIDRRERTVWCSTHADSMPSEALTAYWTSEWSEEERKDAADTIAFLLQRESCLTEDQIAMIKKIAEHAGILTEK